MDIIVSENLDRPVSLVQSLKKTTFTILILSHKFVPANSLRSSGSLTYYLFKPVSSASFNNFFFN